MSGLEKIRRTFLDRRKIIHKWDIFRIYITYEGKSIFSKYTLKAGNWNLLIPFHFFYKVVWFSIGSI